MNSDTSWRLIPPLTASGQLQMQIDTWLWQQQVAAGAARPTIRFYQWERPTISLGYGQRRYPDRWRSLTYQHQPVDVVRRPTGGRAVLHGGDLTYAIALRASQGRQDLYQYLCGFLIHGWRQLGVALTYGAAGRGYHQETDCFRLATGADLVDATGRKLIGSAQRIGRDRAVLQHGSMRLTTNPTLTQQVFGRAAEPGESARPNPLAQLEVDTIVATLTQAAREYFQVELVEQPLSAQELADIQAIALCPVETAPHQSLVRSLSAPSSGAPQSSQG